MDNLEKGQKYKVTATNGLRLRAEPDIKSKILLVMESEKIVKLESEETHSSGGYQWYNVRYTNDTGDTVGWAAGEYLELVPIFAVQGVPVGTIRFQFIDNWYEVSTTNFKNNCVGKYIFAGTLGQLGKYITDQQGAPLKRPSDNAPYWTTEKGINDMATQKLISLILI